VKVICFELLYIDEQYNVGFRLIQIDGYRIDESSKYTKDHLWVRTQNDGTVLVGLGDYFFKRYRNVQSCEFPKVGTEVVQSKAMGSIETVKGTVQIYAAITGQVKENNTEFLSRLKDIEKDPYNSGWILRLLPSRWATEEKALLSAEQYASYIRKLVDAGL